MVATDKSVPVEIFVAVITFNRLAGLAKLLDSMTRQTMDPSRPYVLTMGVIDNDPACSAEALVSRMRESTQLQILYVSEPRQGIPIARNAALDALPASGDYLCFIDDDEWAPPDWLDSFMEGRQRFDAECYYGPVIPQYPEGASEWLIKSGFFAAWKNPDGAQIDYAASNNVMISGRAIKDKELRFDERMRFTGGSDYLFFRQGFERGLVIRWVQAAAVYEENPASRLTWSWILKRHFRIGNTFSVAERILGRKSILVKRAIVAVVRMALGIVMLPTMLFSPRFGMRAVGHIARGFGMLVGLFGHQHEEYSLAALSKNRG